MSDLNETLAETLQYAADLLDELAWDVDDQARAQRLRELEDGLERGDEILDELERVGAIRREVNESGCAAAPPKGTVGMTLPGTRPRPAHARAYTEGEMMVGSQMKTLFEVGRVESVPYQAPRVAGYWASRKYFVRPGFYLWVGRTGQHYRVLPLPRATP